MEGLNISNLAIIVISFSVLRVLEQSFGYLGCFKDDSEQALVDENGRRVFEQFKYNSGSICKRFCENIPMRYAGTKRDFCICINTIKNVQTSTNCTEKCPGNSHEICGSITGASVYDTIHSNSETPLVAVYITISVVILVAGAATLSIFIILRHRRLKGNADGFRHTTLRCQAIVNNEFTAAGTERRNISTSIGCIESLNRNKYCELTYDDINVAEYTTINQSSIDLPEGSHQYGHLKMQPGLVVAENKTYSHLLLKETAQNSNATDNLYSRTGTGMSQDNVTANGNEVDGTYNRLNATPLLNIDMTTETVNDQDSVYDHALAGGDDPTVNDTEYSHLNAMKVKDQNTYSRCFTANSAFSSDNKSLDRGCEHLSDNSHTYFILEPET